MSVKEFHLIGTVQSQSVKLEVGPSDALEDLKSDLAGVFQVWDPKGIDTVIFTSFMSCSVNTHRDIATWVENTQYCSRYHRQYGPNRSQSRR